ncbi:MAG TPA: hypothetical protein PLW10_08635 [Myxococcota bacterium]|nr:hypothetical protein [Myxococcota bacterium]
MGAASAALSAAADFAEPDDRVDELFFFAAGAFGAVVGFAAFFGASGAGASAVAFAALVRGAALLLAAFGALAAFFLGAAFEAAFFVVFAGAFFAAFLVVLRAFFVVRLGLAEAFFLVGRALAFELVFLLGLMRLSPPSVASLSVTVAVAAGMAVRDRPHPIRVRSGPWSAAQRAGRLPGAASRSRAPVLVAVHCARGQSRDDLRAESSTSAALETDHDGRTGACGLTCSSWPGSARRQDPDLLIYIICLIGGD